MFALVIINMLKEFIQQGWNFITNPDNLPIIIGMILIYLILIFVLKGAKHIIQWALIFLLAFYLFTCVFGTTGFTLKALF